MVTVLEIIENDRRIYYINELFSIILIIVDYRFIRNDEIEDAFFSCFIALFFGYVDPNKVECPLRKHMAELIHGLKL